MGLRDSDFVILYNAVSMVTDRCIFEDEGEFSYHSNPVISWVVRSKKYFHGREVFLER
jgi:hypothetical protein